MMEEKCARECNLNPVFQGLYEWKDRLNTKVEIKVDGSAVIIQGDQKIMVDSLGFFRDVTKVFELAIDAMPEGELKEKLIYYSIGTSRSFPICEL